MYSDKIKELKTKFDQVILRLGEDFANIRTGRASAALVENIVVSYYGSSTPLKQMASIATPDASQIIIQPWDKNALGDIELAIKNSDLSLSPVNDGNVVRIVLPPMTQERREEIIKTLEKKGEEARVALRNVRGEIWEEIKRREKESKITEDDRYSAEKEINDIIDKYNKKVQELVDNKEREIRSI